MVLRDVCKCMVMNCIVCCRRNAMYVVVVVVVCA
jgi:hypothetical protein